MRIPTLPMVAVSRCCFIVVDCGCLFCGDDDIVGDNRGVIALLLCRTKLQTLYYMGVRERAYV